MTETFSVLLLLLPIFTFFYGLDWIGTIYSINLIKKLHPKRDYSECELNKLAVFLWEKFGFERGTFIGIFTQIIIAYSLIFLFFILFRPVSLWFIGLIMGGQLIAIRLHIVNINYLKNKLKNKKRKIYKEV